MARTADLAALARVPLSDVPCIPIFLTNAGLTDWLEAHRVEVKPDHAGRPSIDLPTAYRLQDEMEADQKAEEARRRAAAEHLAEQVDTAQKRRQELFAKAYTAAVAVTGTSSAGCLEARQKAWKAVSAAEKRLPMEVAQRLGPVVLDGLPGAAGFPLGSCTIIRDDAEPMSF